MSVLIMASPYSLPIHTTHTIPKRQGTWTPHPPNRPDLTLPPLPNLLSPSPLSAPLSLASSTSHSAHASSSRISGPRRHHGISTHPATASEILPNLYISDLAFAENSTLLEQYRITHILSVLPDKVAIPPVLMSSNTRGSPTSWKVVRMQVAVEDFPFAELAEHLPRTTDFIRSGLRGGGRVLVHCAEGVSRSVSAVSAFLMSEFGWTPEEAVGYVKMKRPIANPNFGFVKQLGEYGKMVAAV